MKYPWIAFYWSDYLTDTAHLGQGEHGAYLLLLARYFTKGEPLPANDEQLMSICRAKTSKEQQNVRNVLAAYFVLDKEHQIYRNSRADEELARRASVSKKRSLAAREQKRIKSSANALHIQSHIQLNTKNIVRAHFAIPSLGEIEAYCNERHSQGHPPVDPQNFFNHYTANGWMVGKVHMKDWRASVRTWERNARNGNGQASQQIQKLKRSYDTIAAVIEGSTHDVDVGVCEVRKGIDKPGSLFVDGSIKRAATGSN